MRIETIGQRLATELRSADLVAAGLIAAFYPAPASGPKEGPTAIVFAQTGDAPPWSEQIWHHEYLVRLWTELPSAANVTYYARIVKDKALLRGIRQRGEPLLLPMRELVVLVPITHSGSAHARKPRGLGKADCVDDLANAHFHSGYIGVPNNLRQWLN